MGFATSYLIFSHNQYLSGLLQDCSNITNALELLQSCTKPLIYTVLSSHDSIYDQLQPQFSWLDVVMHLMIKPVDIDDDTFCILILSGIRHFIFNF